VAEVDLLAADDFVHLGCDADAIVEIAVTIQRAQEARNVGEARVHQLVDVAVYAGHDIRQVETRRAERISDRDLADEEGYPFAGKVAKLALLVGYAGAAGSLIFQTSNGSGKNAREKHLVSLPARAH
jgi:hypothetical protein